MQNPTIVKLDKGRIPVDTPESVGISSECILNYLDALEAEKRQLHSFQIVRHGKLVVDMVGRPFTHDSMHRIASAAKGVVATAVLMTIEDGYYSIDEPVLPHIPKEWLPDNLDPRWNKLTLYHLLTMTDGHAKDSMFSMFAGSTCWVKTFFEVPLAYEPGERFCYDMGAQYVMNELVRLAVGKDLGEYMKERVWDHLDMKVTWDYTEPEHHFFSSKIQMQPEGLTRMGLLYLQEGNWEGKQLVDKELMQYASLAHGPSTPAYTCGVTDETAADIAGYGLHMWRNPSGGYRFCGGQGQLAIVYPEYDMVVSTMGGEDKVDRFEELFEQFVLHKTWARALPENEKAYKTLKKRMDTFTLGPTDVSDMSSTAGYVNNIEYTFEENDQGLKCVRFDFGKDEVKIYTDSIKGKKCHVVGLRDQWKENEGFIFTAKEDGTIVDLDLIYNQDKKLTLLAGGWKSQNVFEFVLRGPALMCEHRYFCIFDGDELEVDVRTTCHRDPIAFMGEASVKPSYNLYARK